MVQIININIPFAEHNFGPLRRTLFVIVDCLFDLRLSIQEVIYNVIFKACCKRRTGLDWTGLDWTGKTRIESVFYKSRTEFVKHGLDWTGKTRTESVFYKSRTEICKTRIESVLQIADCDL